MTANEMIPAVGHTVLVAFEQLQITGKILDVKTAWGHPRFLVTPSNGTGSQWVEITRVNPIEVRS